MSYTETHIGRIRKLDIQGYTVEEKCKDICTALGIEKNNYKTYLEVFLNNFYEEYIEVGGDLYHISEDYKEDEEFIEYLAPNLDGSYTFLMRFYNGGTCLHEMLEDAIRKRKNESR